MSTELITVDAGGVRYSEWESVQCICSVRKTVWEVVLRTTEVTSQLESPFAKWNFPPGTKFELRATGDLLLAGRFYRYRPSGWPRNHVVTSLGVGSGHVLTKSSPIHPTGNIENANLLTIAETLLAPFAIPIRLAGNAASKVSPILPVFQLRRDSTIWEELIRLAEQYGVTISGTADGAIELLSGSKGQHTGAIVQGGDISSVIPIEKMSADLTDDFYSDVEVDGQDALGTEEDSSISPQGRATNGAADRISLFNKVAPDATTQGLLQQGADWLMGRSIGESARAVVTVPTFRDKAGALWTPGQTVFFHSGWLKLSQSMYIEEVIFEQDSEGGTSATLTITDPRSYDAEFGGVGDSGEPWTNLFEDRR